MPSIPPVLAVVNADNRPGPRTLAIDIGGTRLKAVLLGVADTRVRAPQGVDPTTPTPPADVLAKLLELVRPLGAFDRISVGFPGVVRGGRALTAPNLGTPAGNGFPLGPELSAHLGAPARVLNDATVQGLGVISG